jgi:hypothetical protein
VLFFWAPLAACVAFVVTAAVGAPSLWLALRAGMTRHYQAVLLGAVVGGLAVVVFSRFSIQPTDLAIPISIGAASGSVYWQLFLSAGRSSHSVALGSIGAVFLACVVAIAPALWPRQVWPRYSESTIRTDASWMFGPAVNQDGTREVEISIQIGRPCRMSLFLPALVQYIDRQRPTRLDVELTRHYDWFRPRLVSLRKVGPVELSYPSTSLGNCGS